jgi:hypothetical protein
LKTKFQNLVLVLKNQTQFSRNWNKKLTTNYPLVSPLVLTNFFPKNLSSSFGFSSTHKWNRKSNSKFDSSKI